ncbi:hypothetical protein D3C72_686370 [compost metagenome]
MLRSEAVVRHVHTSTEHFRVVAADTVVAVWTSYNVGAAVDVHHDRVGFDLFRSNQCAGYATHVDCFEFNASWRWILREHFCVRVADVAHFCGGIDSLKNGYQIAKAIGPGLDGCLDFSVHNDLN